MLRSNATLGVSESNEFRGPLITKEGVLYDDEDYNETYKAKLRLKEIDLMKEYLKQVQEKGGKVIYEEDETVVDDNLIQLHLNRIRFRDIDKLFSRLKYFSQFSAKVRRMIID